MSASAVARLVGVRTKIERAKHHIRDLQTRINEFVQAHPYEIAHETDQTNGDHIYRLQRGPTIPLEFSAITGDALSNLRAALDHLAWQLVEASGNAPTTRTYFPISDDAGKYATESQRKVEGMSPGAIALIDTIKPYSGGNEDLWVIHELNKIDKHRLLISIAVVNRNILIERGGRLRASVRPTDNVLLKDGAELMRLQSAADMKDERLTFTFLIAFGEPEILKGKPLAPTLHHLADVVREVVDQFVPFL